MKATAFLRRQHEEVALLFEAITLADGAVEKKERFQELACMLVGHDRIEREIFYPACAERMGRNGALGDALAEHGVIKLSLSDANQALGRDDFDSKLGLLQAMVQHHVEEEEKEFFPRAEQLLDKDTLEFLTIEMLEALEDSLSGNFLGLRESA